MNTVLCLGIMAGVIVLTKQTADLKDDGEEKIREVMITMISMTVLHIYTHTHTHTHTQTNTYMYTQTHKL